MRREMMNEFTFDGLPVLIVVAAIVILSILFSKEEK